MRPGHRIGYVRVSTLDQNTERQLDGIELDKVYTDRASGKDTDRPQLQAALDYLREGDTLIVETTGFRDGLWLDRNGSPMTDAARLTERFRRPNYGTLEIELTVDDPKAYKAPWTVKLKQSLMPDTELLDYVCLENEKDIPNLVGK